MANTTKNGTIIEVIETNRVVYKKHKFLFFGWETRESATCLGKDLIIKTNDEINNIYFNSEKLTKSK